MKVLCVAEKPSISKNVSNILSGGNIRVRNSKNKYIKNYDFRFEFPEHGSCEVTMTSVMGHITNIDFSKDHGWGKCNPGRLFDAPLIDVVASKDVFNNITSEMRNAQLLMIWTDFDREGEFIGYEIYRAAVKGRIHLGIQDVWRAQFSHLERQHILYAARNPKRLDMNSVRAVECRMEIDLRVGASFTRFLTELFRRSHVIQLEKGSLISYGTCQMPTLGFVVDRYHRVKSFVPEKYWYIGVTIKKNNQEGNFSWTKNRFFDRLYVTLLYQNCMRYKEGEIIDVKKQVKTNWRPLPLTTVELQKDCSRYFKMSAKRALDLAEKLYNKGFISYPRTETDKFAPAMNLSLIVSKQTYDSRWGSYANNLLSNGVTSPRNGSHDDKAHPPIHPVNYANIDTLDNLDERKVYEYVTRRFLACCSKDAKGEEVIVDLKWGEENFQVSGLRVTETNYLDVYPYYSWSSSRTLPLFSKGERIEILLSALSEGNTSRPSHMTESELISMMDMNGIGTDATIAEHIDKVIARGYIVKVKEGSREVIIPSELGMGLVQGFSEIKFNNISLSKPFLRKRLENTLQEVSEGKKTKESVLHEIVALYKEAFSISVQNQDTLILAYKRLVESNG